MAGQQPGSQALQPLFRCLDPHRRFQKFVQFSVNGTEMLKNLGYGVHEYPQSGLSAVLNRDKAVMARL